MSGNPAAYATDAAPPHFWNTLEDLHLLAMAGGCTKAQFAEAVETVGTNPRDVANYLQRYALTWNVPKQRKGLSIHRGSPISSASRFKTASD